MTRRSPFAAVTIAGLAAAVLDGIAASVFSGAGPLLTFQSVATGLLGEAAYRGGTSAAVLGAACHTAIAAAWAMAYYVLSRKWTLFVRHAVVAGSAYGAVVFFVMRFVVVPLSAAVLRPVDPARAVKGVAIHVLCVGLPIALAIRHWAPRSADPGE